MAVVGSLEPGLSEGDHQLRLFRWALKQSLTIPEVGLLLHVPNGGSRDKASAARLKLEGVRAGVPDLFLPVARDGWHGLWVEMKRPGGVVSREQAKWLERLKLEGYMTAVAYGAEPARRGIVAYLGIEGHPALLTLGLEAQG